MSDHESISVSLQANGSYWRAVWVQPGSGRRCRGLGARDTVGKREALAACRELQAAINNDPARYSAGPAPTMVQWRARYFELRSDLKASSIIDQQGTLALLCEHFGKDQQIHINEAEAANFRLFLEARRISTATVRKHVRNCKTIWQWANRGTRRDNPWRFEASAVPKIAKDWAVISPAALERIVHQCPDTAEGRQCRAIFALCRLAGLRAGEAIRLLWSDIDYAAGILAVRPESVAGQAREEGTKQRYRQVPMSPRLVEVLRGGDRERDGPCCDLPGDYGTLHRRLKPMIKAAGLPEYAKPLHTLRKNLETEWLRAFRVPLVCAWLGNSPAVAAEFYCRPETEDIERITGLGSCAQKNKRNHDTTNP
mgnify:CR=1 FL=1